MYWTIAILVPKNFGLPRKYFKLTFVKCFIVRETEVILPIPSRGTNQFCS